MITADIHVDLAHRTEVALPSRRIPAAAEFIISLRGGSCAAVYELRPAPDPTLLGILAASLGLGVAATLRHAYPELTDITITLPTPVPQQFMEIAHLFRHLTSVNLRFEPSRPLEEFPSPRGDVFVLSGGKDSLYVVDQYSKQHTPYGLPAIYLAGGAELTWGTEIRQVLRVANYFDLNLHVFELHSRLSSTKAALRLANRAAWRELLTITLARSLGDTIHTGINLDSVARLEHPTPHLVDHLSQLVPTLRALRSVLHAAIHGVPGEFTVYRAIRSHPLFSRAGSCLTPACADATPCNKCRGFDIYEKVINGIPLNAVDVAFVTSPGFLGDPDVLRHALFEKEDDHAA